MKEAGSIFQLLLERTACYLPLQDAVREVSRYAMGNSPDLWLRFVREYPHFSDEVLRVLAQDENWGVRWEVAGRKQDLPEDVLRILSQDEDWEVRAAIVNRKKVQR